MAIEYLTTNEKQLLLDLLFDATSSFAVAEKKFKEMIPLSRYHAVDCELKQLCKNFIASLDGVALIMSIYLADLMRRTSDLSAKALFFDIFIDLERAIRRDIFCAEKYKYSSKDVKEPKKSTEATYAEEYRIHLVGKVFAFQLLMGSVSGDEKASTYVSKKQEEIDSLLDSCSKSSILIKEFLADVAHSWGSEKEKRHCSTTLKFATSFNLQQGERTVLLANLITPKIASLPILTGELQLLFPGHTSMLFVENSMPGVVSENTKKELEALAKTSISKSDQDKLLQSLTEQEARHIALNTSLLCDIAEKNPSVCAAILEKIPRSTLNFSIQSALNGNARLENIEAVLLLISHSLDQKSINIFIAQYLKVLNNKSLLLGNRNENAKKFISTLYEFVVKGSKGNKGIHIAELLKGEIEQLITHTDDSDIARMWDEIKS
ncbi:unnamed protein product [Phytomonas sp. Hart1]|nr:unnamed protein product [Phytomonas sp. Hart1]|eukprot:CCW68232.1 unnamed protein product [Phytomonas sp. isolate Hart1]